MMYLLSIARSVQRLVQSLHHDGLTEQLSWLETYLSDEAQDREVDGMCFTTRTTM